jgi:hypothetical protein
MNRYPLSIVCSLLLAGCATSNGARQLATETAVAVQALDAAISQQAAIARVAAASSDARIANLLWRSADERADLQLQLELDPVVKGEFERLRSFVDKQEAERQSVLAATSARIKALADAREQLGSPSEQLRSVSGNLIAIGKRESRWRQLTGSVQFLSDVSRRVQDNAETAKRTVAEAEPNADKADDPKN